MFHEAAANISRWFYVDYIPPQRLQPERARGYSYIRAGQFKDGAGRTDERWRTAEDHNGRGRLRGAAADNTPRVGDARLQGGRGVERRGGGGVGADGTARPHPHGL